MYFNKQKVPHFLTLFDVMASGKGMILEETQEPLKPCGNSYVDIAAGINESSVGRQPFPLRRFFHLPYSYGIRNGLQRRNSSFLYRKLKQQQQNLLHEHKCNELYNAFEISQQQFSASFDESSVFDYEDNEIVRSLQMFATLATCKEINEPLDSKFLIDAIMEDFARNGHVSDDISCSQKHQQHQNTNESNGSNSNSNSKYEAFLYANGVLSTSSYVDEINRNGRKSQQMRAKERHRKQDENKYCVFCENNNEPRDVIISHSVRDWLGRVLCPKLRVYICPICEASGDDAHTVKYCPKKPIFTLDDTAKSVLLRLTMKK